MAATKRNAAGLTSAVPRATLNDEELVRIRPLTTLLSGIIVISRVAYFTYSSQNQLLSLPTAAHDTTILFIPRA